ncbi:MAG: ISAs1 family transposase, partial [Leptospirillia bacterium]
RFAGTCYKAAGWTCLGQTSGFGYRTGVYHRHGQPKTVWARFLSKDAREILCHPDDTPRLTGDPPMSVALDALPLEGLSGLWNQLDTLPDPRKKRGIRHPQLIVLKIVIAGILTGCTNVKALGEWAAHLAKDQPLLERLGCFYSPSRKCYVPPSWTTLHRTLASVDSLRFEQSLTEWVLAFADPSEPIAVDGKTLRGSASPFTKAIHLMSAFLGFSGLVLAQRNVSEKTNEITAFKPLLSPLPLEGRTVTGDAMHTQRDHARFLVERKREPTSS